jgi:hypothetical protein
VDWSSLKAVAGAVKENGENNKIGRKHQFFILIKETVSPSLQPFFSDRSIR